MCHLYKFCTLTEYENLIPFELDVYSALISAHEQRQKDLQREQESLRKAMMSKGYNG